MIRLATRTGRILFTHFSSSFFDIFGLTFTDGSLFSMTGRLTLETLGRLCCRASLSWVPWQEELERHVRCLTFEAPSSGRSARHPHPHTRT